MGTLHRIRDNLVNFVTGLGTSKDPTTASTYNLTLLNRNDLENAYRSEWLARRIVDAPAEDATREWRSWQASNKQIEKIEALEKKFQIQKKLKAAIIRARLYGGAALVLGVEQGESQDELDFDSVGADDLKFVVVLNRYELNAGPRIYNVMSPYYTRPEYYTVASPMSGFDYDDSVMAIGSGMTTIHPSRVIELAGNELPDWRLAPMGGGWGDSVLQTCDQALKDYGLSIGGIANMINDAKMDVVKIPNFSQNIATAEYANLLWKRFAYANQSKSTINTLLLDSEEEWNRIQTTFSGLSDIMQQIITIAAGAAGIPVSRLMGQAPSKGLNKVSGGEQDLRNYYDSVSSLQKTTYAPALDPLDRVLVSSALGKYDPNIFYEWTPLYIPDPAEEAAIALQKAQTAQLDQAMGLINPDVLRQARINQLVEDSTYPGIEDAIEEFGEAPSEPEVDPNFEPGKTTPPAEEDTPRPTGTTLKIVHSVGDSRDRPFVSDYDPDQPRDEKGQWTAFHSALSRMRGGIDLYHEAPGHVAASFKKEGIRSDYGVFATIGQPSDFVTRKDKTIVHFRVPVREHESISPDMRYDPDRPHADLMEQHPDLRGADVSFSGRVPPSWIVGTEEVGVTKDYDPDQPRDDEGRWTDVGPAGDKGARATSAGDPLPAHVPRIPPAWTDVRVSTDPGSHLLVVGRDSKGRQQAIYSAMHSAKQARVKFARTEELVKKYGTIEQQNETARRSRDPKVFESADATKLIMSTGIRPGGDKDTGAAQKAYGATTLEGRHVVKSGGGVRLQFVGKKGVSIDVPVEDRDTAEMLLRRKAVAGDGGRLFPSIGASDLLAHVHSFDGGSFKTKDFRTLVANRVAAAAVRELPAPASPSAYKKAVRAVAKVVSAKLGNTPTVALQSYINPAVFAHWRMHAHA